MEYILFGCSSQSVVRGVNNEYERGYLREASFFEPRKICATPLRGTLWLIFLGTRVGKAEFAYQQTKLALK